MIPFRCLALILISLAVANGERCVQGKNCFLPDCFCPTFSHPLGARNIPQIVYFGFDDAVTPEVGRYFKKLFSKDRLNPNGCPITMSLYVCHHYTKYDLVKQFFKEYDEIAVHSVSHTYIDTADKLRSEAYMQKMHIVSEADVPAGDIIGWRSPDLITAGDDQPRVLKELNFTYDISLPYEFDDRIPFPYTLDYGYPFKCSIGPCPGRNTSHKGFWEVPINTLYDKEMNVPCTYVDGCRPPTADAAYRFLMENFLRTYHRERAPFGLNMHAAWFFFPIYMQAMDRFIQTLVNEFPDVYIISVQQMVAWMKNPQNLLQSRNFQAWGCNMKKEKQTAKVQRPDIGNKNIPKESKHKPTYADNKDITKESEPESKLNPLYQWLRSYEEEASRKTKQKLRATQDSLIFQSLVEP